MNRVDLLTARFSTDHSGPRIRYESRTYPQPGVKVVVLRLRGPTGDLTDEDWRTVADGFWSTTPPGTCTPIEQVVINGVVWLRRTITLSIDTLKDQPAHTTSNR